jgi:class 3 adenylate cyclase
MLMAFQDPAAALRAAVDLQQLVGGVRVQVGIAEGARSVAVVDAGDSILRVSLGAAVDGAARASSMAPAGTIRMDAAVFGLMQDQVRDLPHVVVTTEYDSTGVEAVSLVMAPRASEAQSTFAGLGRL